MMMNFINIEHRIVKSLLALALLSQSPVYAQELSDDNLPEQIVNTMEKLFGAHAGERRNHIKGICAAGSFVSTAAAKEYSRSPLFDGDTVPVLVRFSLPGGNPNIPDTAKTPRGMAINFKLPDGDEHNMTMLNVPVFGASTPLTFLQGLEAKLPDPKTGKPDPDKVKSFKASHPDTWPLANHLSAHNPPASYATTAYHSLHAFVLSNDKDESVNVKWRFVPELGEIELSDDQLKLKEKRFLKATLLNSVKEGPISWDMVVSIGHDGDPLTDPTIAWPQDREEVTFGKLMINKIYENDDTPCEEINFDPLLLTDGFEATDDPVLQARSPAYAISAARRLNERGE